MAKCNCCGREMLTANGCSYKRVVIKGKHKKTFNRIKVGDPGDWYEKFVGTPEEKDIRCGDCGAKIGYYHHYGCDIERLPLIGCRNYSLRFMSTTVPTLRTSPMCAKA